MSPAANKFPPDVSINADGEIVVTFTFEDCDPRWMHMLLERLDRPTMKQFRLSVTGDRLAVGEVTEASVAVLMSELNAAIRATNEERGPEQAKVIAEAENVRSQVQGLFKAGG